MRKLVSSRSALEADRAAEESFGYPPGLLMEEAGIRLQAALEEWGAAGPIAYLAGGGNNGGDALVMARQAFLRGTRAVTVVQVLAPSSPACVQQQRYALAVGVPSVTWPSAEARRVLAEAALWVDGLWGTGLTGPLRAERAEVLRELAVVREQENKPCAAIDVPSGLWEGWAVGDPVLPARWTLAAGRMKDFCFYPAARPVVGQPVEVTLAFPRMAEASAEWLEPSDLGALLPRVDAADHKGRRGHVVVLGGAPGMSGALVLAARSAAASGAGLLTLGVDAELTALVAPQVPAFQVRSAGSLETLWTRYDAAVVGPGWGRTADREALLARVWATELPLVLDAEALTAWTAQPLPARTAPVVLTPHPGEFARLGDYGTGPAGAAALAREKGVVVVLKGAVTWILAPDGRRCVWDGANPALGTGGSGDCLAGVVGALLARGLGGYEAARAAVALHGTAGRSLADRGWFTADALPEALARTAAACMLAPGPL